MMYKLSWELAECTSFESKLRKRIIIYFESRYIPEKLNLKHVHNALAQCFSPRAILSLSEGTSGNV